MPILDRFLSPEDTHARFRIEDNQRRNPPAAHDMNKKNEQMPTAEMSLDSGPTRWQPEGTGQIAPDNEEQVPRP